MSEKENNIDLKPGVDQDDLMDFDRDLSGDVDIFTDLESDELEVVLARKKMENSMKDERAVNLSELKIDDLREMYADSDGELKAKISMAIAKKQGLKNSKE